MVEMLAYIAILFFVVIFVVFSVLYISHSYRKLKSEHAFAVTTQNSFDRIGREVRDAGLVDPSSSLGVNPGVLVLQPNNITFYLDNGDLMVREGSDVLGKLNLEDSTITNLIFTKMQSSNSEAVKVEMEIEVEIGDQRSNRNFDSFFVLRGSY